MSSKYKFLNPEGVYFTSFAVVYWIDVFTRRLYKDFFIESLQYCVSKKGLVVHGYVIMTNHIHLIISKRKDDQLSGIFRDLKKFTAVKLIHNIKNNLEESRREWMLNAFLKAGLGNANNKTYQFWQQNNHPLELMNNKMIEQKLNYIHQNPVEVGFVFRAEDYLYSSAADYAGEKGLLKIELLV